MTLALEFEPEATRLNETRPKLWPVQLRSCGSLALPPPLIDVNLFGTP